MKYILVIIQILITIISFFEDNEHIMLVLFIIWILSFVSFWLFYI